MDNSKISGQEVLNWLTRLFEQGQKPKAKPKPNRRKLTLKLRLVYKIAKTPGIYKGALRSSFTVSKRQQSDVLLSVIESEGLAHSRLEINASGKPVERWYPGPGDSWFVSKQGE